MAGHSSKASTKNAPLGAPIEFTPMQGSGNNYSNNKNTATAKDDVLDSWEDESISSSDTSCFGKDDDNETTMTSTSDFSPASAHIAANAPPHHGIRAPPPTPAVSRQSSCRSTTNVETTFNEPPKKDLPQKRPEKQTTVANRMIQGALGIRSSPRTEQQKAYDRAVFANEKKRRNEEKLAEAKKKEEAEKAKAAIWEN